MLSVASMTAAVVVVIVVVVVVVVFVEILDDYRITFTILAD